VEILITANLPHADLDTTKMIRLSGDLPPIQIRRFEDVGVQHAAPLYPLGASAFIDKHATLVPPVASHIRRHNLDIYKSLPQ
jgi:hypothetical protein